jgi:thiosulfate/3-mercaptopyruvate sulfurtransferase
VDSVIVDTEWLASRLEDAAYAVVDVRQPYFYGQGHVPGAVNLPDYYLYSQGGDPPAGDELAQRLGALGVTRDTHVVAYDDGGSYAAARLFWVLRYFRHQAVSVLDGGVTKWRAEGRDWEYSAAPPVPVTYQIGEPDGSVVASFESVVAELGSPDTVLLDVRSPAEYLGRQVSAARNGRIPGSINIDWSNNLERVNGSFYRFRSPEQLRPLYETAGVSPDKQVIVYCQAGGRSSATFLALQELGYPRVQMYPAGWQEWGNRGDTPVEEG